ncbi:hypothetical protein RhiXN_07563 [Rhizoctonia solani]|uniref:Uncharacterized protein n=1 Tax=Rhizoctonia solani TaxID=456999 RepID=A0A8H8SZD6_9AGAM|nr:uncharacterized protein RhiXN_07563 [Rhizoctonia solani]QRW22527.1 hypothetical protein RhiXN_07563 [Rhizoctonia solani]
MVCGSLVASPSQTQAQGALSKEPSKPAANPKETQQLKRKAKNNQDEPATKRQQSSHVVELAVDKEAKEQGPSKQKICPRMEESLVVKVTKMTIRTRHDGLRTRK